MSTVRLLREDVHSEVWRVKNAIMSICENAHVYVFGSALDPIAAHVRDLDFLITIPKESHFKTMRQKILCDIPRTEWALDLIVVPAEFLEKKRQEGGNFYFYAFQEGIHLDETA